MTDARQRALDGFRHAFGRAPGAAAFAPGRVNLIGDHTDYAGGLAMPMALGAGCVAAVGRADAGVRAVAVDMGESFETQTRSDPAAWPGWARYAIGSASLALDAAGASGVGLTIAVASDVPMGGGLSSSAALEVAVVSAVGMLAGVPIDPMDIARMAQRAEHEFAGVPCGLLDQMASVFARAEHAMIIDFADFSVRHIPIPDAASFLIVDTGVRHDNASGAYAALRERAARARAALGVEHLGRADGGSFGALPADGRAVAEHVVSECARVRAFAAAVTGGQLELAGAILDDGHASLVHRLGTSPPEVEAVVGRVRRAPGVLGCRLTGAGFGGSVVALTQDPGRAAAVLEGLGVRRADPGGGCRAVPFTS
ncbi:MAG: galactokinase family protein [Phycisphaerales bacterium]